MKSCVSSGGKELKIGVAQGGICLWCCWHTCTNPPYRNKPAFRSVSRFDGKSVVLRGESERICLLSIWRHLTPLCGTNRWICKMSGTSTLAFPYLDGFFKFPLKPAWFGINFEKLLKIELMQPSTSRRKKSTLVNGENSSSLYDVHVWNRCATTGLFERWLTTQGPLLCQQIFHVRVHVSGTSLAEVGGVQRDEGVFGLETLVESLEHRERRTAAHGQRRDQKTLHQERLHQSESEWATREEGGWLSLESDK